MSEPTITAVNNEATSVWSFDSNTGYDFEAADVNFNVTTGTISLQNGVTTGTVLFPALAPAEIVKFLSIYSSDSTPTDSTVTYGIQYSNDGGVNWGILGPDYNDETFLTWTGSQSQLNFIRDSIKPKRDGNDQFRFLITLTRDTNDEPTTGATYYVVADFTLKITNHNKAAEPDTETDIYDDQMTDYANFDNGDFAFNSGQYFQVLWVGDDADGSSPYTDDEYDATVGTEIDWPWDSSQPDDGADYWIGVRVQYPVTKGAANTTDTWATFHPTTLTVAHHQGIIYDTAYDASGIEGDDTWPAAAADSDYISGTDFVAFTAGDDFTDWQYEQTPVLSDVTLTYLSYSMEPEEDHTGIFTSFTSVVSQAGGPRILPYNSITEQVFKTGENNLIDQLDYFKIDYTGIISDARYTDSLEIAANYYILCEMTDAGLINTQGGPVKKIEMDDMQVEYSQRQTNVVTDLHGPKDYCSKAYNKAKMIRDKYYQAQRSGIGIRRANQLITEFDDHYLARTTTDGDYT